MGQPPSLWRRCSSDRGGAGTVLDEGASWVPVSGPQACGSLESPTPAWGGQAT